MRRSAVTQPVIRGVGLLVSVGLLVALVLIVAPASASPTAAIEVTTKADTYDVGNAGGCGTVLPQDLPGGGDGQVSLREAICAANNTAGADTITFSTTPDPLVIVLGGTVNEDANDGGDLDILAGGGDLTIQGNGAAHTIVDGDLRDRVIDVCPGADCDITVVLDGLTIRNGHVLVAGGGISNRSATLRVQNCTVGGAGVGNEADVVGGGIHNGPGASATIDASDVSSNTATYGGGIYNVGTLMVQNGSTVGGAGAGNRATGDGGGIYNPLGGSTTVDGSTVSANIADDDGGGIYNAASLTVQKGGTIGGAGAGNEAGDEGGGIYNSAGTATVDASEISSNTAVYGGGIYNEASLTVQNGGLVGGPRVGNRATNEGGGIYNSAGTAVVDASFISSNTATWDGGGIYNSATLTIENGSVVGGAGAGNEAWEGGGIYNRAGTATVDSSTVSANIADEGGGGIYNSAKLTVRKGSTVGGVGAGNRAIGDGGGILNGSGTTTVDASTVSSNTVGDLGGGIFNFDTLIVRNGSLIGGVGAGNHASTGGGIYNGAGTATVDASAISANEATGNGGGIFSEGTLMVQNGSTVGGAGAGNQASWGGGIYNLGTAMVDASAVSANMATAGAGGIRNGGTLTVENGSTVGGAGSGNQATGYAGGIYNLGTATVDASTISANRANEGGGILNEATLAVQNGSTIGGAGAGNEVTTYGGGIYNWGGTVTVDASTISANRAGRGGGIYNWDYVTVQNRSAAGRAGTGNEVTRYDSGIYGTTWVTNSRLLNNAATMDGGGILNDGYDDKATTVISSCICGNSDASFLNTQTKQQDATGNWWGAVTGPNTPGADTVEGDVDTSGFLTAPILGCTPDLQVAKANDAGGATVVGQSFTWTLTLSSSGLVDATFLAGQTILVDELPQGPAYGSPAVTGVVSVTNSAAIDCGIAADTLTCRAEGAEVVLAAGLGRFSVVFAVVPQGTGTLTNPAGMCQVDPDGHVLESEEDNNDCPVDRVEVGALHFYLPCVLREH